MLCIKNSLNISSGQVRAISLSDYLNHKYIERSKRKENKSATSYFVLSKSLS
jgi:hypothetical protein